MRKSAYVIAALATIAVAAPSIASADTVVIKHRDHHHWLGARAEYREHRDYGWHKGWWHRDYKRDRDRDRVIIRDHRDRDRY